MEQKIKQIKNKSNKPNQLSIQLRSISAWAAYI